MGAAQPASFSPSGNHSPGCSGNLFLERLQAAFDAGMLGFYANLTHLADRNAFAAHVQAMRRIDWLVYAKKPFGGPARVLAYLGHTPIVSQSPTAASKLSMTISTSPSLWKDYRQNGAERIMRLKPDEFIRRFLLHTLPDGFHRDPLLWLHGQWSSRRQDRIVPRSAPQ